MRGGHWRKLANDIQGISSESKKFTMNILKVRNKKKGKLPAKFVN